MLPVTVFETNLTKRFLSGFFFKNIYFSGLFEREFIWKKK